ncbi:MAG TPA: FUSC family protein [Acidimicrobiales bacterium]|nr:FUSC family protein [Acidimicrobiales bacterium]
MARALREATRAALQVDRSKVAPDVGLRAALGVGLTLIVGRATGHTVAGVTATIGALSAGMASHQGTYRSRAAVVMAASAGMAFTAFLGALVGHILGLDMVVTGLIGFCAGMLVSLGPAGSVVGIQAVVGLVVFSQFHLSVAVSARNGGLILLGGLVQTVLVVVLWPLRRFPAERRALGDAFARLAGYCRTGPAGGPALPDPAAFDALGPMVRDAQPFGGEGTAAHRALAGQVERIRLELVALVRARQRLAEAAGRAELAAMDDILDAAASALDDISRAVREGEVPSGWLEGRNRFESGLSELRAAAADQASAADLNRRLAIEEAHRRGQALAGQLRAVVRTAAVPAGGDPVTLEQVALSGRPPEGTRRRTGREWVRDRAATVRSNLTLSSQACRHALRMAVSLAAAVAISHAFRLDHAYWLPMTAMLVLRPDFGSTVTRGISRVVGTLIGAGLVTLVLAAARPGPDWLIGVVIVLCFAATTLVLANYAVFSVCIASLVVTLLAFLGEPELSTAGDRSIFTVLGAVLALAAYALWPTWEVTALPDVLAELAETEGRYAAEVLAAWADPAAADRAALQRSRLAARLARSNAEASVARWLAEPPGRAVGAGLGRDAVLGYLAAVRSCVQAILTLHAELPTRGGGHPEVEPLAGGVGEALRLVAGSVRGSGVPSCLPPLRKEQLAMARALGLGSDNGSRPAANATALVLAGETDLLVNSVNTLGHLVGLETGR